MRFGNPRGQIPYILYEPNEEIYPFIFFCLKHKIFLCFKHGFFCNIFSLCEATRKNIFNFVTAIKRLAFFCNRENNGVLLASPSFYMHLLYTDESGLCRDATQSFFVLAGINVF